MYIVRLTVLLGECSCLLCTHYLAFSFSHTLPHTCSADAYTRKLAKTLPRSVYRGTQDLYCSCAVHGRRASVVLCVGFVGGLFAVKKLVPGREGKKVRLIADFHCRWNCETGRCEFDCDGPKGRLVCGRGAATVYFRHRRRRVVGS